MRVSGSLGLGLSLFLSLVSSCTPEGPTPDVSEESPEVWTLSADPILTIGDESAEETAFERIAGVFEHESGHVIVVDGGTAEIRAFSMEGVHTATWGGKGDGPGEFRRPKLLGRIGEDTMVILDEQDQRISTLTVGGEPGWHLWLLGNTNPEPRQAFGVLGSGQVVFQKVALSNPTQGRVELLSDTLDLFRLDPSDETVEEIGPSVAPIWVWTGEDQVPMPFSPRFSLAARGDQLYTLNPDGSAVLVYGPEGLQDSWSLDRTPEPVSRSHRAAYRESVEENPYSAEWKASRLSALDHPSLPRTLPFFDKVIASEDDEVWVRRYHVGRGPKKWDVFSTEGRHRGFVETPGDLNLRQVNERHVLGVFRDSLGVESVRVYEKQAVVDSVLIAAAWTQVRTELANLVDLERIHFADFGTYTSDFESLIYSPPVEHLEVVVTVLSSGRAGFSANASHPILNPLEGCAVFWGNPDLRPDEPTVPAEAGEILCSNGEVGHAGGR